MPSRNKSCCVVGCRNRDGRRNMSLLLKKIVEKCELQRIGNPKLFKLRDSQIKNERICQLHFHGACIDNSRKLKKGSLTSINLAGHGGQYRLALHASKNAFERITGHLERHAKIQEELDRETAHKKYIRDTSKAMTDTWENSVDNIRKSKREAREQRLAKSADDKVEYYHKVLKSIEEKRKKFNEKVKIEMLKMRGAQRDVNTGVLLSECLYVNGKLIELKNKEKEREHLDWKEYEDKILREDQELEEKEIMKQCKRRVIAGRNRQFLKEQFHHSYEDEFYIIKKVNRTVQDLSELRIAVKEKKLKEETKIKIEEELSDVVRQKEEMEIIEKNAQEDFLKNKRRALKNLKESRERAEKSRRLAEKEDADLDIVCNICIDTRRKINCVREEMRKQGVQERSEVQTKAFKFLEETEKHILDDENHLIAIGIEEHEETEILKNMEKEEHCLNLREERNQAYKNALEKEQKKKQMEQEEKKWQTFNRMKAAEVHENKDIEKRKERIKRQEIWNENLISQLKENELKREEQKAKEDALIWSDYPEKDEMFLKYGAEALDERKVKGKPTYPVEKPIMEYKKTHRLLQKENKESDRKDKNEKDEVKFPIITRRVSPQKNNSYGIQECFCNN